LPVQQPHRYWLHQLAEDHEQYEILQCGFLQTPPQWIAPMRAQIIKYWDRLRSSFWFLPSLMALAAVVLSFTTVAFDQGVTRTWLRRLDWVYSGGAEGASAVLQTIAGSMITIAGVVFSLTLVALSLASSQFGPRLLRNFMRDTANQLVLGTFIATFLYCLLVLRTIRREEGGVFVPHVSVTLGVIFALVSLWVLIYFIHHVSVSIQADEVVARVGAELNDTMDRLFPEQSGESERSTETAHVLTPDADTQVRIVSSVDDGYLQIVDVETLMNFARETDTVLTLTRRPGHYIVKGMVLVNASPAERVPDDIQQRLQGAFVLGNQRTAAQDVEFAILQLVEIATRALSPGVNDPFTAIACIDRLGSAFCRLAQRQFPAACRYDDAQRLRIIATPASFSSLADAAFSPLRNYAKSSVEVTVRLLESIALIASVAARPADRAALQRHADMIAQGAEDLSEAADRNAVSVCHQAVRQALAALPGTHPVAAG